MTSHNLAAPDIIISSKSFAPVPESLLLPSPLALARRPSIFPLRSQRSGSNLRMHAHSPLFELEEDPFAFHDPFGDSETTRARSGKASYTPALPAAVEWLLLSTEPPTKPQPDPITTSPDPSGKNLIGKLKNLSVLKLSRTTTGDLPSAEEEVVEEEEEKPIYPEVVLFEFRKKLDVDTPIEELPRSWDEYTSLYSRGEIDIQSPPLPPSHGTSSLFPSPNFPSNKSSPFEAGNYPAPRSTYLEPARQRLLTRIDLLGQNQFPSGRPVSTIRSHPGLQAILERAKRLFKTRSVVISILTNYQQIFLAESGMPDGVDNLPRATTYCGHTILNEDAEGNKELVVLDTKKDWRFKNNVLSVVMGTRFYAGVPVSISAPTPQHTNPRPTVVGTLCIMDDKPRSAFSAESRAHLASLAREVESEIEFWVAEERFVSPASPSSSSSASISSFPFPTAERKPSLAQNLTFPSRPKPRTSSSSTANTFSSTHSTPRHRSRRTSPDSPDSPRRSSLLTFPTFPTGIPIQASSKQVSFSPAPDSPPHQLSRHPFARRVDYPDTPPDHDDYFPSRFDSVHDSIFLPDSPPSSRRPSVEEKDAAASKILEKEKVNRTRRPSIDTTNLPRPPPIISTPTTPSPSRPLRSTTRIHYSSITPSPTFTEIPPIQQIFDLAVQTIGRGLSLSLVYLITVTVSPTSPPSLSLQSVYTPNSLRSSPLPKFDLSIHLKALNAKAGGLVYLNPKKDRDENDSGYESGLLVPCWSDGMGGGMVIGGFTRDKTRRSFTEAELKVFKEVGGRVEQFVTAPMMED